MPADQSVTKAFTRLHLAIFGAFFVFGYQQGAKQIHDNGTFTHLRTGIDMAKTGAIPRTDPYTFTAHGHSWTVQSWLPEWTYGWAYRIGGYKVVIFEQAVLIGVLALLIGILAKTDRPWRTLLAGATAIAIGVPFWEQRPLIVGLIAFALFVLIVERGWSPWWLLPVVWVWVNSHGSFPLAVVWLAVRGAGEAIDNRAWPATTIRYGVAFLGGLVVSLANPLGYRLLAFPLTVATKRDAFKAVIEWNSPNFQQFPTVVTLIALAIALVIIARRAPRWTDALPAIAFVALALYAERNVPVAAVVMAPVLGRALRPRPGERVRQGDRDVQTIFTMALAIGLVVALGLLSANIVRRKPLYLARYPVAAVDFLTDEGLRSPSHRVATSDRVGNYLEAKFGTDARAFIDDRYDMFPSSVVRDYRSLVEARANAFDVLDRRRVDVVLWDRHDALATLLRSSTRWQSVYQDNRWEVFQRT
jgi:hypothetical protein